MIVPMDGGTSPGSIALPGDDFCRRTGPIMRLRVLNAVQK